LAPAPASARAIAADESHPRAEVSRFRGQPVAWRQLNPHGVPCFPGSFEDASRRIPDVRTRGTIHPRRLLLFVPPPTGFFPFDAAALQWGERGDHPDLVLDSGGDPRTVVNPSRRPGSLIPPTSVVITTSPGTFTAQQVVIEDLTFTGSIRVSGGRITLRRVAAKGLLVETAGVDAPVVDAVDCLFDHVEAADGLVRLEGTTVMEDLTCRRLQATDCLFAGTVDLQAKKADPRSCVRFSRVPANLAGLPATRLERVALTTAEPVFFAYEFCPGAGGAPRRNDTFGDPGYATLDPATPDAITSGAEDGGEMGADHQRATCLARAAVLTKLAEFLPLGIEAVLVPDPRLLVEPPRIIP
jgi:hypothetical protein